MQRVSGREGRRRPLLRNGIQVRESAVRLELCDINGHFYSCLGESSLVIYSNMEILVNRGHLVFLWLLIKCHV